MFPNQRRGRINSNTNQAGDAFRDGWRGRRFLHGRNQRDNGQRHASNSRSNIHASNDSLCSLPNEPTNRSNRHARFSIVGFKKLEHILKLEPSDMIIDLLKIKPQLVEFLDTDQKSDIYILLVNILARIFDSEFKGNLPEILVLFTKDSQNFTTKLCSCIFNFCLQSKNDRKWNKLFWDKPQEFWENLYCYCNNLIEVVPFTSMEIVPKIVTTFSAVQIRNDPELGITEEISELFDKLNLQVESVQKKEEEKKVKKNSRDYYNDSDLTPPNNYRDIAIYPSSAEIKSECLPFLRKNVIKGKYESIEQYLDIQFRLLREDFVAPLREGIREYLLKIVRNDKRMRISNIKIYQKVSVICTQAAENQMGTLVQVFKPGTIKNLANSRRFMYGALVCFTTNNFDTFSFGKIINRDPKYLNVGQVIVGFELNAGLNPEWEYVMAECTVYFEPYFQVLKALKHIDEHNFPFKKYLIDIDVEREVPDYWLDTIVANKHILPFHRFMQLDPGNCADYDLNYSQFQAYKAALTSKFSIIQGPPGTGKTYLSLKMAKTLLENKELWLPNGPILVICYTNHALDQFLEGLLDATKKIMRVGGQCKNENIEKLNIKHWRKIHRKSMQISEVLYKEKCRLAELSSKLKAFLYINDIIHSCNGIIDVTQFNIDPRIGRSAFKDINFIEWLLTNMNQYEVVENFEIAEAPILEDTANEEVNNILFGNNHRLDLDEDDDDDRYSISYRAVKLEDMLEVRRDLEKQLRRVHVGTPAHQEIYYNYLTVHNKSSYLNECLYNLKGEKVQPRKPHVNWNNPNAMHPLDRWQLYSHWIFILKDFINEKITDLDETFRRFYNAYHEVRDIADLKVLQNAEVVGMTTTGAAKLHESLKALHCPIVIVEEAAEVLESHVITALSKDCKQLILVGDHKQLRPSTADYTMCEEYSLGISLFERMVLNDVQCHTLNVQHRMHPNIACLVSPIIYPQLENHESVFNYHKVTGIDKNLFFIHHTNKEHEANDSSKLNKFEAEWIILLARHLVLNNYDPSRITILVAYSGQFFEMNQHRRKYEVLKDLKIRVLDNYQGEENDIVLLSLVRNNNDDNIGFLKLENRICVALSRAKHGMYIMGNIDLLCKKNTIWQKIREELEESEAVGESLTLRCEKHREQETVIKDIKDFNKVPEGGCMQMCSEEMECGHFCKKVCHIGPHTNYKCEQPCKEILCDFGHVCPKRCHQECGECMYPKHVTLPCGHEMDIPCHMLPEKVLCPVIVNTELPCKHRADKPCFENPKTFKCPEECDTRLICGHSCTLTCHIFDDPDHLKFKCVKTCDRPNKDCSQGENSKHLCKKYCSDRCDTCNIKILKSRKLCNHKVNMSCSEDADKIECEKPCTRKMPCGHVCPNKCNETCGPCMKEVVKPILACGHMIKWQCSGVPERESCKQNCDKILACGHGCTLKCKEDCSKGKCKIVTEFPDKKLPCGHMSIVPCYLNCDTGVFKKILTMISNTANDNTKELLKYCKAPCGRVLKCGHPCAGTCGDCFQGRLHKSCQQKCSQILVCGHECTINCRELCQPCQLPCTYKCAHSTCRQKCGAPCKGCMEPCKRKCQHGKCDRKCSQFCNREPCNEPCERKLKCGHPCVGFCGEKCPSLCRICDEDELTEIFFGDEDEEDARFVELECKHVMESKGMDTWFEKQKESENLGLICCPKCKTTLSNTPRYSNYIKAVYKDIDKVKWKLCGNKKLIEEKRKAVYDLFINRSNGLVADKKGRMASIIANIIDQLKISRKGKRQFFFLPLIEMYEKKYNLLNEVYEMLTTIRNYREDAKGALLDYIDDLLLYMMNVPDYLSQQQLNDINIELNRMNRLQHLAKILNFATAYDKLEYKYCTDRLLTIHRYNMDHDEFVLASLKKFNVISSSLQITHEERKQILGAVGLSKGHWFKCRNGHVYCIGECGRAMQAARCPECNEPIGGQHHALTAGNSVATEMDGAMHGAFSEAMNIANFRFDNLHL